MCLRSKISSTSQQLGGRGVFGICNHTPSVGSKLNLRQCRKCKTRFFGKIEPTRRFCSISCSLFYSLTPKDQEEDRLEAERVLLDAERKAVMATRRPKKRRVRKIFGEFYSSDAWLDLRYRVIKKHGRRCMACGEKNSQIHVDHIKPKSKFPELALIFSNLQVLCRDCNKGKSNRDSTDWRPKWN